MNALASCAAIYVATFSLRHLAASIVEVVAASITLDASSLRHLGLLLACALLSWVADRQSRAAQAAASLVFRLMSSLMVRPYFKAVPWPREARDWLPWVLRSSGFSPNPSTTSSFAGSENSTWSGKDISSFRIPDRKLKARGARWASATFNIQQQQQQQQQRWVPHNRPGTSNAPLSRSDVPLRVRSRTKCPPTSPVTPRSPLTFTLGGPRSRSRPFSRTPAERHQELLNESMLRAATAPEDSLRSSADTAFGSQVDLCQAGVPLPPSSLSSSWSEQATASFSSFTALLKPLVPTSPSFERIRRWQSSPSGWPFSQQQQMNGGADSGDVSEDEEEDCATSPNNLVNLQSPRRTSIDLNNNNTNNSYSQASSRHYTYGDISAENLSRCAALSRYASSARTASGAEGKGPWESAIASVGLDGDCPPAIRRLVTDEHLLQLGALLDEASSQEALHVLGVPPACEDPSALCGIAENLDAGWEQVAAERQSGLRMHSWRKPLRKGLFVYKTIVTIEGVAPGDIRPFHLDDQARALWDDGALAVSRPTPAGCSRASRHAESCLHSYLSKFPGPMAPRRYNYARRVWHRPSDGGCYVVCQACDLPEEDWVGRQGRTVQVLEFTSATVIRAVSEGSEITNLYFEDSQVRPGLAKVGVPKGLWPFWTRYEAALRLFAEARAVTHAQHLVGHSRRSVDGGVPIAGGHARSGISSDDEGSDDELYGALAELKAARRAAGERRGGALGASSRWARRIVIAGALKMMHVMLASN